MENPVLTVTVTVIVTVTVVFTLYNIKAGWFSHPAFELLREEKIGLARFEVT